MDCAETIPWEMGKQLLWDDTIVDAVAPSLLNQGSLCNPGTTTTEAEARKIEKYRELRQWIHFSGVGGKRSKERDRKSELVLSSTYQIFEWDRNNSDRNFYNVVRYVHIPLVP